MTIRMLSCMRILLKVGKAHRDGDHQIDHEYGRHNHKQVEHFEIALADTLGDPRTVMIVPIYTKLAILAVSCC